MKVERFIVGQLETNCYLVSCDITGDSVIIDPGGISDELLSAVKKTEIRAILLTHGHFDHSAGVGELAEMTGVPVMIHPLDAPILNDPIHNGSYLTGIEIQVPESTVNLSVGENVKFGESSLTVVHTPGHTPGGVSFVDNSRFIIAGDTLFRMSIGRWDLPGGNYDTLIESLRNTFHCLPDEMEVFPGHGDLTTIGFEKMYNPFLSEL